MRNRRLNKFNLICEQQQINLIYEANKKGLQLFLSKRWSLDDEFECMLEFIKRKVETAFTNLYDNQPGELQLTGDPDITELNQGTQEPGYKVEYYIDEDYVKNNLFPYLKQTNYFSDLNEKNDKFHFFEQSEPYDTKLILKVYAKSEKFDLSKPDIQIPKFGIENWNGEVYFNFKCADVDRNKSSVSVGDISVKVEVKEYQGLLSRFLDILNGVGKDYVEDEGLNKTLGDGLFNIFGVKKKKNKGQWDRIETQKGLLWGKVPGANIKCTVTLDKNKIRIQDTLDRDYNSYLGSSRLERANKTNNNNKQFKKSIDKKNKIECLDRIFDWDPILEVMQSTEFYDKLSNFNQNEIDNSRIGNNIIDNDNWTTADRTNGCFISTGNPVTQKYIDNFKEGTQNEYICLTIHTTRNSMDKNGELNKTYQLFLYIGEYINHDYNSQYLFKKYDDFDAPTLKILISDNNDETLFERYFTKDQFSKFSREFFNKITRLISNIKLN